MRVGIEKSTAVGSVTAPPSKSAAHRLLICASLAEGESRVRGISDCEDVRATADCLRALGAKVECDGRDAIVRGFDPKAAVPREILNCRESGSTLRFFIPIALLGGERVTFIGSERLMERPLGVYRELCSEQGLTFEKAGRELTVRGTLRGGEISVPGDVSSQFITGLLFALPLLKEDTRIRITTEIESLSYINLTVAAMAEFGVSVVWEDEKTLYIRGGQSYGARDVTVEGDYSAAAFTEAFNLFGGRVTQLGLGDGSLQGDRIYREHYEALRRGYAEINIEDCPDLGPILFAVAAGLGGGRFTGTARLRIKESDRAAVMARELSKFGARLSVEENSVTVHPTPLRAPEEILLGHNDHRIVMALAVLCSVYGGVIDGAEAVKKSYPDFFSDISALGIKAKVYEA